MDEKPSSLKRLAEILGILRKHKILSGITPEKLLLLLTDLGPAFVKIGQIISMRPEILPLQYNKELAKLRTDVSPMGVDEVKEILAGYGDPLKDVLAGLDPVPLGSASIAQVHLTRMPDGKQAVVKVVRPGVYEAMSRDIQLLKRAAKILHYAPNIGDMMDLNAMLDEIWAVAKQETDLNIEAANAAEFAQNAKKAAYSECPEIYDSYDKVLVMEYIQGIRIDHTRELISDGGSLNQIAETLAADYIRQIVTDGFFHADPHPGNLIVRKGKIVWIDLGMMGRIGSRDKELIYGAISAVADDDIPKLTDCVVTMCACGDFVDRIALNTDLEILTRKYARMDFETLDIKQLTDDLITLLKTHRISLPKNISMLMRGILALQGTIRLLDPRLNLMDNISSYLKNKYLRPSKSKKELLKAAVSIYKDSRQLLKLPAVLSDTMQAFTQGGIKTHKEISISRHTMSRLEKLVNRLIAAWVFTALFIGSSMIFAFNIPPRAWGVPIFGLLGYAAAFASGAWLAVSAVFSRK